jgi:hypothetical protein
LLIQPSSAQLNQIHQLAATLEIIFAPTQKRALCPRPVLNFTPLRLSIGQGKFLERETARREIERGSISHWRPRATSAAFAATELCALRSLSIFLAAAAAEEKTDSRSFVFEPLLGQYWLLSCAPRALVQHHMPNPLTHSADE